MIDRDATFVCSIPVNFMDNKEILIPRSRIMPTKGDDIDTVKRSKQFGNRRAFDILMEAQHYWNQMDTFRRERERNKRYNYGDQWGDIIEVDGQTMTEEEYIKKQGSIPLKNNLIRRFTRRVLGTYRGQMKEPTCTSRDRSEQEAGETMSIVLQANMQLNKMNELHARSMEEFLISGFIVHRKWHGWRNGKLDCWTDYINPNNFFIDNNMRDFRGWDVSMLGEVHDISFGELVSNFANSPSDYRRLKEIYEWAAEKSHLASFAEEFGYSKLQNYDFLFTSEPGRCRVIEVWRKEQKPRFRCHDVLKGTIFKVDTEDYKSLVVDVNNERLRKATESGMDKSEVPLIESEWFVDDYWYYYYLTPFGDILDEGETPYWHGSHPYVFKAYPFIDGEIHSFVSDIIDQQRYTNRLITLYDWIMRASAKGVLLVPEDSIPDGMSVEEFAEAWTEFNGVVVYKPSASGKVPTQVANNSTNIGISELLNLQLKFFEDISGVSQALQGKPGFSGQSAAMYSQQVQNSSMSLLDLLESYSNFVVEGAYKDVKNIQQFYDDERVFNISGKRKEVVYTPDKIRDVEMDISISESTTTPVYRQINNDTLMQLFQMQAINIEQLLEYGTFPFADELLQSIKSQKEQMQKGEAPEGIPPELMQQAQQGADMGAVEQLRNAIQQ